MSQWESTLIAHTKHGTGCVCFLSDVRILNKQLKHNTYLLPNIQDFSQYERVSV